MFQYFSEYEYYYAHDPEKICKTGDMVLIQRLPEKLTRLITHKVLDVVYPCGDVTDPITGRKVVVSKYRYVAPFVDDYQVFEIKTAWTHSQQISLSDEILATKDK